MLFYNVSFSTAFRHILLLIVMIMMVLQTHAQSNSKPYIPADLLTNKTPVDEIVVYQGESIRSLFWPTDRIISKYGDHTNPQMLVTSGKALYLESCSYRLFFTQYLTKPLNKNIKLSLTLGIIKK